MGVSIKKFENTNAKMDELGKKLDMLMESFFPNHISLSRSVPNIEFMIKGSSGRQSGE